MASFYVSHTEKFNAGGLKGIGIHNERKSENSKNQDIDKNRSHLNYDLHKGDNQISYEAEVNKIIKKNYTSDRKIRANAVIMTSTVISASPEFFENKSQEEIKKYFEMNYDYLKERIGESNVISATVHMDEKTPHMHFCSVPITEDGRLCAKEIYNREALRELQSEPVELVREIYSEIERGKVNHTGKSKHVDSEVFKVQELEKKINDLKLQDEQLKNLFELSRDLKKKKTKSAYNLFFDGDTAYTVRESQIDSLIALASRTEDIPEENKRLEKELTEERLKRYEYEREYKAMKEKKNKMSKQIDQFKRRLEKNNLSSEYIEYKIVLPKARSRDRGLER